MLRKYYFKMHQYAFMDRAPVGELGEKMLELDLDPDHSQNLCDCFAPSPFPKKSFSQLLGDPVNRKRKSKEIISETFGKR